MASGFNRRGVGMVVRSITAIVGMAISVHQAVSAPITTAFTYQGQLTDGGVPTVGLADFRFALFDAASGGAQVGATLCADNVVLDGEGRFTVQLDFGQQFSAGQARFLLVEYRADTGSGCGVATGFAALTPRQAITSTPSASFALTASDATTLNGQSGAFYQNAANLTAGTIPDARLASTVVRTNVSQTITGITSFTNPANAYAGSGSALAGLNATNITLGTLSSARLPVNAALLDAAGVWSAIPVFNGGTSGTTPPFSVDSTFKVTNLNADLLDGLDSTAFATAGHTHDASAIVSGLLADARLSSNVALRNASNTFSADAAFLTQIGIGAANSTTVPLWVQKTEAGSNLVNTNTILALENNAAAYVQMFTPVANESGVLFGHVSPDASIGSAIIYNNTAALQGLQFRTGGNSTRMTLDSGGFLGIGTSTPAAPLHVVSNIDVNATGGGSFMVGSAGSLALRADANEIQAFSGTAASVLAVQAVGGNFGVGTISPAEKLHVVGNGRIDGNLEVSGTITVSSATRFLSISADGFQDTANIDIFPGFMQNSAFLSGTTGSTSTSIQLPQGATVTGFQLLADDTGNTNVTAKLYRQSFNGSGVVTMATVSTTGTTGFQSPEDTVISSAIIGNNSFFYRAEIAWAKESNGSITVYGIRVQYTVTSPLP